MDLARVAEILYDTRRHINDCIPMGCRLFICHPEGDTAVRQDSHVSPSLFTLLNALPVLISAFLPPPHRRFCQPCHGITGSHGIVTGYGIAGAVPVDSRKIKRALYSTKRNELLGSSMRRIINSAAVRPIPIASLDTVVRRGKR
jgi:hypothetical protein